MQTFAGPTEWAGFWRRFAANFVDGLLLAIPLYFLPPYVGFAAGWLYFAFMESSVHQGTLGKKLLGIKVTDLNGNRLTFGRATGRYFGKIISNFTLLIGYMMAGWTQRKQALHDMIAGCLVVVDRK